MALEQYVFGSGKVYYTPLGVAVAQPVQVGTLQETSVDVSWSEKGLQGQLDAPAAMARGALKITGKVKNAKFKASDMASVIFGNTLVSSGTTATADNEGLPNGTAVPSVAPYTITVANAATFLQDLGVVNVNTGVQLTCVASAPTTGQYMVAAGVYTFAAADEGMLVAISYQYSKTGAGKSFTYYAQPMGFRPTFKLILSNSGFMNNPAYAGQPLSMTLWSTGISKLSLDFKNEDWAIPESDFSCAADFMNRVMTIGADS